jgi:predicted transcriptional regulator
MLKLTSLGWGAKRIAKELGCSHNTVRRYLRHGGYLPYRTPRRASQLAELKEWLRLVTCNTAATPMWFVRICNVSMVSW